MHYMNKNQISTRNGLRGSIICTASNSGLYAFPLEPMYAAAKHGVVGLVRSLGVRLGNGKIQINGLAPCVVGMLLTVLHTLLQDDFCRRTDTRDNQKQISLPELVSSME